MAYIPVMQSAVKATVAIDQLPEVTARRFSLWLPRFMRRKHARTILAHADAAKVRQRGKDLGGMTADKLVDDLLAYRVDV